MKRLTFTSSIMLCMVLLGSCSSSSSSDIDLLDSTIIFDDGVTVSRLIGSGVYTNGVSGVGAGEITYSSGTESTATVNINTGEVTLLAVGSTIITAHKAATATHAAVTAEYTLTITALTPSTIVFVDGSSVKKTVNSALYINTISGIGSGNITYSSGTDATATVNSTTGEITVLAVGTTLISANKAATGTHAATSNTYTLTVVPGISLVSVPSGSFQRDSDSLSISSISRDFHMSAKEITVEQYISITGFSNPSSSFTTVVNGPVQKVSWYHTLIFCNKLSIAEGLTPVYTISGSTNPNAWGSVPPAGGGAWDSVTANWNANGYRLPTEMEWMWAAMGATNDRSNGYTGTGINATGYVKAYAGSTETGAAKVNMVNYTWYSANSGSTTHSVGSAGSTGYPNELGLYDLSGNVWEWCWDKYAYGGTDSQSYTFTGTVTDYYGATSSSYRVVRGGSWQDVDYCNNVSHRGSLTPYTTYNGAGFRVVRL